MKLTVTISPPKLTASLGNPVARILEAGSLPVGGVQGDVLIKKSATDYDAEWVAPASAVEANNTLPITSAAVYTEVGNINALLATI